MKKPLISLGRMFFTLVVVVLAALVIWRLVAYYMFAPWTRDGHVRADVVQIAPDVSGIIAHVEVSDNEPVQRGQVLFTIDPERFKLALRQAESTLADRQTSLDQAEREMRRNRGLGNLVATEELEESQTKVARARAAVAEAKVAIDTAKLNLKRATVVSPVNGYINDRAPRASEYAVAGRPALSVVDSDSFHVDGYFEETKLPHIHVGQRVDIRVIGEQRHLQGHVQSIAAGIEDRDRSSGANLLPNVNPTFSWVRLAQRIPVRIALDNVPDDVRLIAGRTATVSIITDTEYAAPATEKTP
ncbi:efflux RND transporter periplasmic adaptor subunit [Phytohalomonas tamaricis]|uniref:efflux RND transporter periplasmic adaptor subunit n=1 Tax=Phytohalomonas tamaricis TaxID=2081032 RepID=UPI000D0B963A|nr:HlyD family secretion protein [Phytohalomonas tamaricis]